MCQPCLSRQRLTTSDPQIWLMALCVTCVFAVTLSVFPVITVRVQTVYEDASWGEETRGGGVVPSALGLSRNLLLRLPQVKCSPAFAASSSSTSWTWSAAASRLSSSG